jgi:hypothetical protein
MKMMSYGTQILKNTSELNMVNTEIITTIMKRKLKRAGH